VVNAASFRCSKRANQAHGLADRLQLRRQKKRMDSLFRKPSGLATCATAWLVC